MQQLTDNPEWTEKCLQDGRVQWISYKPQQIAIVKSNNLVKNMKTDER